MKDSVLVKENYIYYIKENILDIIITLETNLGGLGNLRGFFSMNLTP
jgi:hypothetical protein